MTIASLITVDRAAHELRCGRAINIDGTCVIHPEYISAADFKKLRNKNARLVITKNRAKAIFARKFFADQEIALKNLSMDQLQALISGRKLKTKISSKPAAGRAVKAALELAQIAETLPCVILFKDKGKFFKISAVDILKYQTSAAGSLEIVADAPLKLADARQASIKAFRSKDGAVEHLAIIIGKLGNEPIIRIHSSCYTGDLLGSLTCDCGEQLRGAIKLIDENFAKHESGGVIIYLMQEGRGIGLINKLRAYELQAQGLDTVEANEFLGFDDEERSFAPAVQILKRLGIKKVKLVTNNPKKIAELEKLGIKVTQRLPMVVKHQHNQAYLQVKSSKSGHFL